MLTNEIRRDFTFVHPEYLATDKYLIRGNQIHLDNKENLQDYKLVIIPGGKVISVKTLRKIKAFYDNGGNVIATTLLPSLSAEMGQDQDIVQIISEMFGKNPVNQLQVQTNNKGGKVLFIPNPSTETLSEALGGLLPGADVAFSQNPSVSSKLGAFSYLHKVRDGKDIYFFANSSDNIIDTEVLLRGKVNLESWNPHDGSIKKLPGITHSQKNGQTYTRCKLNLAPVKTIFWISK